MYDPADDQQITPPSDATKLAFEVWVPSEHRWARAEPWREPPHWTGADTWPDEHDAEEWGALVDEFPDGVYRFRWSPDDRRTVLQLGPVVELDGDTITVIEHPDLAAAAAGTPPPFPRGADNPAVRAAAPPPPPRQPAPPPRAIAAPPEPTPPPSPEGNPYLATLRPVMNPPMTPEMASHELQQFLIIQQLVAQQNEQVMGQMRAMCLAMVQASQQSTATLLEVMRQERGAAAPASPPPGLDPQAIDGALARHLAPLLERLDDDDAEEPDTAEILSRLAAAQKEQPKSFLEQLIGFLQTPAGQMLASGIQRAMTSGDQPAAQNYSPPEGNLTSA